MTNITGLSRNHGSAEPSPLGHRRWRAVLHDPAAVVAILLLGVILTASLLAPLYARHVAHTDPLRSAVDAEILIDGIATPVLADNTQGLGLGVTPIGPGWRAAYLLGADSQGRDIAARLLAAGRNSLLIATGATLLCLVLGGLTGLIAGAFGGWVDHVISRVLDMLWAFPVTLLAISLSLVLVSQDLHLGPVTITASSLWLPVLIVGVVYVPYIARPVRAQVQSLMRAEFVRASVALGVPFSQLLRRHITPFVLETLATFAPLVMALCLLTESALSFLSVGVQPPDASWGTLIGEGQTLIYIRPMAALAPGLVLATTVVALNMLGDALKDLFGAPQGPRA